MFDLLLCRKKIDSKEKGQERRIRPKPFAVPFQPSGCCEFLPNYSMKKTLLEKFRILFLCLLVAMSLSACSNPRGADGKTKLDQIIALKEETLNVDQINIQDISDEQLKEEIISSKQTTVTIPATTWASSWKKGWFDGLIVWPIAQMINLFASFTDAGWGIILATLIIQLLIFAFTYKSQISQQRMQEIQPQMTRIQNKYAGKNDERSKMLMAQEMQKLYADNDIHPFGSILMMFIQLPVMMGMFYATMRAVTTVYGSFMGMPLSETPLQGFQNLQWGPITVYVLMIVMSLLQMQLPKWLSKLSGKDKPKNYADRKAEENNPMTSTMNMTMYMTTGLIAFMYISWPIAMSFYWLVSSIIRAGTTVLSHFVSEKEMKKREAEEAAKRSTGILKNRKGKK